MNPSFSIKNNSPAITQIAHVVLAVTASVSGETMTHPRGEVAQTFEAAYFVLLRSRLPREGVGGIGSVVTKKTRRWVTSEGPRIGAC